MWTAASQPSAKDSCIILWCQSAIFCSYQTQHRTMVTLAPMTIAVKHSPTMIVLMLLRSCDAERRFARRLFAGIGDGFGGVHVAVLQRLVLDCVDGLGVI